MYATESSSLPGKMSSQNPKAPETEAERAEELRRSRVEMKEICKAKWRTFLGEDEIPAKFLANLDIDLPPKSPDPK